MSPKRKNLLIATIAIILGSYIFAFYLITNNTRTSAIIDLNTESKYKGNQRISGSAPFDQCFGRSLYNGNAILTIKNGSSSDAVVNLFNLSINHTVRNVYVRKNENYTIYNISEGYYRIKVLFGNDWNPETLSPCGIKGYFDSNVYFVEFDRTEYFEDSLEGYTVATITLYTVSHGNASTSRINQTNYFGNLKK